jgi:hypothetical protein
LTGWLAVLSVVAAILGGLYLQSHRSEELTVVVATHAIDAFGVAHQLEIKSVERQSLPSAPIETIAAAENHYVLRSVKAGDALGEDDIGPEARKASDVVIAVPLKTEQISDLRDGQTVDLLLSPSVANVRPAVSCAALIVHVVDDSTDHLVYMAIPRSRELRVASVIARGDALIVRRP